MSESFDPAVFAEAAEQLARWGRWIYERGWSPATSSNYSMRLSAEACAITTSGRDKGLLSAEHIMAVDLAGLPLGPGKPSAETLLHTQLYKHFPAVGAVLHTHSVAATVLSLAIGAGQEVVLEGYELAKALPGVTDHQTPVRVPVVANHQDMTVLGAAADAAIARVPHCSAYLICGHGLYAWGASLEQVRHQVEALEFLFSCALSARTLR